MTERVRLMDQPADYQKLGVNPDRMEPWEDRRRTVDGVNTWEWWYFDSILDDGSQAVAQFFTTDTNMDSAEPRPNLRITITAPDGTKHNAQVEVPAEQAHYGTERCDVALGPHLFQGDLADYHIKVADADGLSADLRLHSTTTPFRPGAGFFSFSADDQRYYTWLCAVPAGQVSGTLTYGGATHQVHGRGYHDHQWGTIDLRQAWNHWTWARQSFDDHTILVFDMTARKEFGSVRFPLCFIQDADGQIVFQNTRGVDYHVLGQYTDPDTGKIYPKDSHYVFDNQMGHVEYTLHQDSIIETINIRRIVGEQLKSRVGKTLARWLTPVVARSASKKLTTQTQGFLPSYARYNGHAELALTPADGPVVERSGQLIYEFMYPGLEPAFQNPR